MPAELGKHVEELANPFLDNNYEEPTGFSVQLAGVLYDDDTVQCVMLMLLTIDATEKRDVAIVDIPRAFIQAKVNDVLHLKMEGRLAKLLVKLDPKLYRKFLSVDNGRSIMYVKLKKALYRTLQSAILFWKTLTSKLVSLVLRSTDMMDVLQTKSFIENSVQIFGMWIKSRYPMLRNRLYLKCLLSWKNNMGKRHH